MKAEVLISTMNKKSISELRLEEKNILKDCTIINQITDIEVELINEEIKEKNIRMLSFKEKGLSRSRNRALANSRGEILFLTDDDVSFINGKLEYIIDKFTQDKDCDILTFKYYKKSNEQKKYKNKEFIHDYISIRKVCSIEIAIKRESILKNNIKYDELFGLGSVYNSGEENIFLKDCLDKKMKIKFIPIEVVDHPPEVSGNSLDLDQAYGKGALFFRMYGKIAYILGIPFIFSKRKIAKSSLGKLSIKYFEGIQNYRKSKNRCF